MRWLIAIPLAGTAVCVALEQLLGGGAGHPIWVRTQIELAKALALTGALVAAFSFHRGDYLRRAWLISGGCMALLLLRDLTLIPPLDALGQPIVVVRGGLVLGANLSAVVGTWMLARAWKVAGLQLPGGRLASVLVLAIAVGLAGLLASPAVVSGAEQLGRGDWEGLVWVASGVGDLICLCLIAPMLLTALALRGGRLVWPWGLWTASMLAWLLYDAANLGLPQLDVAEPLVKSTSEAFRCLACLCGLCAGLAQRRVVLDLRAPGARAEDG